MGCTVVTVLLTGGFHEDGLADVADGPVALDDYAQVLVGSTLTLNLVANDSVANADAGALRLLDASLPGQGAIALTSTGIVYQASGGSVGSEQVNYLVDDGQQDLRHYWRMDGDLIDSVGTVDGTISGSPTWTVGRWGTAPVFDNNPDRASLPDLDYGNGFSLGFWFKLDPSQTSGYQTLFSHGIGGASNSLDIRVGGIGDAPARVFDSQEALQQAFKRGELEHRVAHALVGEELHLGIDGQLDVAAVGGVDLVADVLDDAAQAVAHHGALAGAAEQVKFKEAQVVLLMTDNAYEPSRTMARGLLKDMGIETRWFDPLDPSAFAAVACERCKAVFASLDLTARAHALDPRHALDVARERGVDEQQQYEAVAIAHALARIARLDRADRRVGRDQVPCHWSNCCSFEHSGVRLLRNLLLRGGVLHALHAMT